VLTDEPVEFEKHWVEVQDSRRITDPFTGIYMNILRFGNEKPKE
jgi:hypothetical protein